MISQPEKTLHHRRSPNESYEERCERRQETRENLRRRNNVTTCRRMVQYRKKEMKEQSQSSRQQEFLRRRNLVTEEDKKQGRPPTRMQVPLGQDGGTRTPLSIWSRTDLRASTTLQVSWNNSMPLLHHKHLQPSLKVPRPAQSNSHFGGVSSESFFSKEISKRSQGTQTLADSSTIKKDSSQQTDCGIAVLDKEIIQLSNYLKEALHRELLLKQKMVVLQGLLSTLLQASEKSWQGQLNEDKLKCKLRTLENKLQTCTQSCTKEGVKKILIEMEDQKQTYEQKAKESIQKVLEEKLQAEEQLQTARRSLAASEEDCALWKEHYETLKADWSEMTSKHTELENKLHILQNKLQWADSQNNQLHGALRHLENEHVDLDSRVKVLQEDNALKAQHVSALEEKLKNEQIQKLTLEKALSHLHNLLQTQSEEQSAQAELIRRKDQILTMQQPPSPVKEIQNTLFKQPQDEEKENLMDQLQKRTSVLKAKEKECAELRAELEALGDEYRSCLTKLHQCRDELNQLQGRPSKRQCGLWIPVLMVVIAAAVAAFLANVMPPAYMPTTSAP
ncbi:PREDICTED: TRAF3-interacting JNK-activating modulator [Gavialis gangeticus]|uniref:TRAF3-interacting JNK-activating modulator n=1 Tax=Gavialis gangeticus TaxID=94835 RepID=UPI00092FC240|nr:PREDICTED: TRAF3-interacting JNK-activating modulator [Gavialis gangeticus]XP_019369596.1 PREDICTED: TRAF3-interacting JNK-activating modulator [Gavialis gangeticus]